MNLVAITDIVLEYVRDHETWALVIVLALAFGESLAFVSLLLPATMILLGVGALIGAGSLTFWPLWTAAMLGAALGDWLSFWLGLRLKHRVADIWPLSRHPHLLPKAHGIFERWGIASVFVGRFFGPLRATVPLAAGIAAMPSVQFQIANVTSAAVWAAGLLAPGAFGLPWLRQWLG